MTLHAVGIDMRVDLLLYFGQYAPVRFQQIHHIDNDPALEQIQLENNM
jgi:hypothetical protein